MTPAASASATRRSYDAVAGDYARAIGAELADRPLERAVLAVAAEFAGTGLVLDVGCGPGHVGRHLASLGARVVATDLAAAMCAAVGRGEPGLPCFAADMTALALVAEGNGCCLLLPDVEHPSERTYLLVRRR